MKNTILMDIFKYEEIQIISKNPTAKNHYYPNYYPDHLVQILFEFSSIYIINKSYQFREIDFGVIKLR
jgi:hypothetical protein